MIDKITLHLDNKIVDFRGINLIFIIYFIILNIKSKK